jgi:hypothetical protein
MERVRCVYFCDYLEGDVGALRALSLLLGVRDGAVEEAIVKVMMSHVWQIVVLRWRCRMCWIDVLRCDDALGKVDDEVAFWHLLPPQPWIMHP